MAKKKYYAVRIGKVSGIYETWEDCSVQVKGVSGAEYKSFSTIEEATDYLTAHTKATPTEPITLPLAGFAVK